MIRSKNNSGGFAVSETPKNKPISPSAVHRRAAKRRAWDCFFSRDNSLTLIAATLIPIVMYVVAQGIYAMLDYAIDPSAKGGLIAELASIVDLILILPVLPLAGGTLYIVTGLARGEMRRAGDVFYAYTSPRAHFRTWGALLIPLFCVSAVVGIVDMILLSSQGLAEMAWAMEAGKPYASLLLDGGILFAVLAAIVGALLCTYVMPLPWLVFLHPDTKMTAHFGKSVCLTRGRLIAWIALSFSFLGWLLLSVVSVGILLVLFVLPYYLLTVTFYTEALDGNFEITD